MFLKIMRRFAKSQPSPLSAPLAGKGLPSQTTPYPPVDPGIRLQPLAELLEANKDIVERLRLHAALAPEQFQSKFLGPIERLADVLNCLPATATSHFSGQGGLLRAAVEMAFQSFQASDGRIFTGKETVERRHALEVRWRYACFVAGLLYPVGAPLDAVTVTSATGATWRKQLSGLVAWAASSEVTHIYINWPQATSRLENQVIGPSPSVTAYIQNVIGPENMQWLEDGSGEFVKLIYSIAGGQKTARSPVLDLLESIWKRILSREEARRPLNYGRVVSGTHMGPYLAGVLRDLYVSGAWVINDDVLMVDKKGIYLVWPAAAKYIIDHGRAKNYAGWPGDASTIESLLKATEIVLNDEGTMGYTEIVGSDGDVLHALQLTNPLMVISDYEPSDYEKQSPKNMELVRKDDPLPRVAKAPKKTKAVPELVQGADDPAMSESEDEPESESEGESIATVDVVAPNNVPIATEAVVVNEKSADSKIVTPKKAQGDPNGGVKNDVGAKIEGLAPDIRFADLIPSDLKKQFRNPLIAEFLGKIIKTARTESLSKDHMRTTENGLAIQRKYLQDNMRDINVLIDALSNAGFLYTDPATPGRKVYEVAIPAGSKPATAIILSRLALKKLDI